MTPQLAMEALQDMDARDVLVDALLEAGWLDDTWNMAQLRVGARSWAEAVVAVLFKQNWSRDPWVKDLSWLREESEDAYEVRFNQEYWRPLDREPDRVILSPSDYENLRRELSEGRIQPPHGAIQVVSDTRMPPGRGALVDLWEREMRPMEERWQREIVDRVADEIRKRNG